MHRDIVGQHRITAFDGHQGADAGAVHIGAHLP